MTEIKQSQAELASIEALEAMYDCLRSGVCFRLEAGAGAGKTYSLVHALLWIIKNRKSNLGKNQQRVACITYTNAAKDEIERRIDSNPLVEVATIHSFCWNLISGFQKALKDKINELDAWVERLEDAGGIQERQIDYNLGHRYVNDKTISLHHDDVIPLTVAFMENAKFNGLISAQFPIILIDEYQDTNKDWIAAILKHFIDLKVGPMFGFFGDHWQKIYGNGCGELSHPSIKQIGKKANFRSVKTIVDGLNNMRPDLPQFPEDENSVGEIRVFHTNNWKGERRTGQGGGHWTGDLPEETAKSAYRETIKNLEDSGWDFTEDKTKILMLTHRLLASEQGYPNIVKAFRYRDDYIIPDHPYIQFFYNDLEPARDAFLNRKYGVMMNAFSSKLPLLKGSGDKAKWTSMMSEFIAMGDEVSVGVLIDFFKKKGIPQLPEKIIRIENELSSEKMDADPLERKLQEATNFRDVQYSEVRSLVSFLKGHSPFATKHGVKGLEFENVLVVIGRGWNQYNFGQMLDWISTGIPKGKEETFIRNRNLFYVTCSRAKKRLALLFTQELTDDAISVLEEWYDKKSVVPIDF